MSKNRVEYDPSRYQFTRAQLVDDVSVALSTKRFNHVLSVEQKAIELALRFGGDIEEVSIASLLHDYVKELDMTHLAHYINSANLDAEMLEYGDIICHGPAASVVAREKYGIHNQAILDAIANHTVGGINMSLAEKIVYVADYIEDGRQFKGVDKARELAESDLDAAVDYEMTQTLKHLIKERVQIYPGSIRVYNHWEKNYKGS